MKPSEILIIIGSLILLQSGCIQIDRISPEAPANPDQEKLLTLVNDVRSTGCDCGDTYFPPVNDVVWDDTLEMAAQNHSNDMNEHDNLSHTGSDGSNPGERINAVGYEWSTYGENVAVGYSSEEDVIEGWLDSPGHCRNIMNGNVTEMGVATSGSYWTQVFAKPK
jgi:uncharacterized protein YkwD